MNGSWTIRLSKRATREFRSLDEDVQDAAQGLMEELECDGPAVDGAIPIEAYENTWRARFYADRFRMVYQASPTRKTIVVIRIGPRGTVYTGMKAGPGKKN